MGTPKSTSGNFGSGLQGVDNIGQWLDNTAERAFGTLRVPASVSGAESVTIGTDVFVIDIINTSSALTVGAIANVLTNTSVTWSGAHGLVAGDLFKVDSEMFRVVSVTSPTVVVASRARCGTSAASHSASTTAYISSTPGTIVGAGHFPIGLVTTLTPAAFLAAFMPEVNIPLGSASQSGLVYAFSPAATIIVVAARANGVIALATTETLAGSGNVWDATTMGGGIAAGRRRILTGTIAPNAAQITALKCYIPLDFDPVACIVRVATSAGANVAWDGTVLITAHSGSTPAYVTLDDTGETNWTTGDTIHYLISE